MSEQKSSLLKNIIGLLVIAYLIFRLFSTIQSVNTKKETTQSNQLPYSQNEIPQTALNDYIKIDEANINTATANIIEAWNKLNDLKGDPLEKINYVSNSYILEFKNRINQALYSTSEELEQLSQLERFEIISTRKELLNYFTNAELIEKNEKEIQNEFFFVILSTYNFPALSRIKFISENKAYGVFQMLNNYKGVRFVNEANTWKANFYEEEISFKKSRIQLLSNRINQFNTEEMYYLTLFDLDKRIFSPIK